MRKRKRDWSVLVYQYGLRLPGIQAWGDLPEAVRQEAEAQRSLWNALVDVFAHRQAHNRMILSQIPVVADYEARVAEGEQTRAQALAALKAARQRLRRRAHPELEGPQAEYAQARTALREVYTALTAARATARAQLAGALK